MNDTAFYPGREEYYNALRVLLAKKFSEGYVNESLGIIDTIDAHFSQKGLNILPFIQAGYLNALDNEKSRLLRNLSGALRGLRNRFQRYISSRPDDIPQHSLIRRMISEELGVPSAPSRDLSQKIGPLYKSYR